MRRILFQMKNIRKNSNNFRLISFILRKQSRAKIFCFERRSKMYQRREFIGLHIFQRRVAILSNFQCQNFVIFEKKIAEKCWNMLILSKSIKSKSIKSNIFLQVKKVSKSLQKIPSVHSYHVGVATLFPYHIFDNICFKPAKIFGHKFQF